MDELQTGFKQTVKFSCGNAFSYYTKQKKQKSDNGTPRDFICCKDIRTQCTSKKMRLYADVTIVLRKEPSSIQRKCYQFKHRGIYFHVHNQKLRNHSTHIK